MTFANPYLPIVPGSTQGQLGTPPGNTLQQFTATGNVQLPWSHDPDIRRIVRYAQTK